MNKNKTELGDEAEAQARKHLETAGLRYIESNYRCKLGEIDLILRDKNCYVFVEVRMRSSSRFGGALASVTPSKQRKVQLSAQHYLQNKKLFDKVPMRFDVVALNSDGIDWVQGAF